MVLIHPSSEALYISQQTAKVSDAKGSLFPFFTNDFYSFLIFLYLLSCPPWRACFEASFPPLDLSLQGYRLLIGHRGEVKGMGVAFRGFLCGNVFFVSITLVSTPVLIFSSWVQLSNSTSARVRSKELLLQRFAFPMQTSGHVWKVKV